MIARLKVPLLLTLLVFLYVLFSYSYFKGWWNSSVGSFIIIFLSYLIWGKGFLKQTGLQLDLKTITKSIGFAVIIAACALLIMKYIGNKNSIQIAYLNWRDYYHVLFYTLNEEMVLGAILLFALVYRWKIKPIVASISLAVFFSWMHFVFYRWIFSDMGTLNISTLITLLLVGFVRNSLIIHTGHIGYSWGLHFGWIALMFGSGHVSSDTGLFLTETETFNLYLGSPEMLIISTIMAGFFLVYWIKKQNLFSTT